MQFVEATSKFLVAGKIYTMDAVVHHQIYGNNVDDSDGDEG